MSQSSDDEYREWVRRLRDQPRRDAGSLAPRPDYPAERLALTRTREALADDLLRAWADWAATA